MTVQTTQSSTGAMIGDGQNNVWPFSFPVQSAAQVQVLHRSAGGGETVLAAGDYGLQLVNSGRSGGIVTYPLGDVRLGPDEAVTIRRVVEFLQPTNLRNQGTLSPETVEAIADRAVYQILQLREETGRGLRVGPSYTVAGDIAPADGKYLRMRLLEGGAWEFYASAVEDPRATDAAMRVLYAADIGLKGDGTSEVDKLNQAMLDLATAGGGVILWLKAPAGYWPIDKQVKVRSGITLAWASPQRLTATGSMGCVGNLYRDPVSATLAIPHDAGDTGLVIDTGAGGVGAVSSLYAIGDYLEVADTSAYLRVTALDDDTGTVWVEPGLASAASAGAGLRRLVSSYVTADIAQGDNPIEIPVEEPGAFAPGDVVWLIDDEVATDTAGSGTSLVNSEMAVVTGYGAGTITLDRPIRHPFSTAQRARVVRVNAVRNAAITGINVEFVEPPSATRVDTVQVSYGYRCRLSGEIPNTDDFGSRGQGFRLYRSLECGIEDSFFGPPKYRGSGEGYAFSLREATACWVKRCSAVGPRHVLAFSTCTDCTADEIEGRLWRNNLIDFHGLREIECGARDIRGVGGRLSGQNAISFGNPSWSTGCFHCRVQGGEVSDIGDACVRVWARSNGCEAVDVRFRHWQVGVAATDIDGLPTAEVGWLRVACRFINGYRAASVDMNKYGGVNRPFFELDLSDSEFVNFERGLYLDNLDKVVIESVQMRSGQHEAGGYHLELYHVTDPYVARCTFDGGQKLARVGWAPIRLEHCTRRNAETATILQEAPDSAAINGCAGWRDAYLTHDPGFTPDRAMTSAGTVLSLPGMS